MKIIIAGSRDFNNYELLRDRLNYLLKNASDEDEITIISGGARGADQLGERYAKEKGYKIIRKPANWDKYGKSAGYKRNEEMAKIADVCVCFWDGESRGTKHMIDLSKKYKLKLNVIFYKNLKYKN